MSKWILVEDVLAWKGDVYQVTDNVRDEIVAKLCNKVIVDGDTDTHSLVDAIGIIKSATLQDGAIYVDAIINTEKHAQVKTTIQMLKKKHLRVYVDIQGKLTESDEGTPIVSQIVGIKRVWIGESK